MINMIVLFFWGERGKKERKEERKRDMKKKKL
jgi:hypothetical protein